MNFCFIVRLNRVGGCETLVARMSNWLVSNGHFVTVLTDYLDPLLDSYFLKESHVIQLFNRFDFLQYPLFYKYVQWKYSLSYFDVIKSVYIDSCYMASVIANQTPQKVKILAGMYAPHEFARYNHDVRQPHYHRFLVDNFLRNIPTDARIACFGDLIKELKDNYGEEQSAIYWPLPIADVPDRLPGRNPIRGKLVSIGRIAPMKEYNIWMVDVVKQLYERGHDITYHIYGYGSYEDKVRDRIQSLGIEKRVFMHGRLAYDKMGEVLLDAYAFIGMGTAAIEAAQQGVPSYFVPAYDTKGTTYGPIYRFPTEYVDQENIMTQQQSKMMIDELENLLSCTQNKYQEESNKSFEYAKYWSLDNRMKEFMAIVDQASFFKKSFFYYQQNYIRAIANRIYKLIMGKEIP